MGQPPRPNLKRMQADCDAFNAKFQVGSTIFCWPGVREGEPVERTVRFPAQIMGGHSAVVYVAGGGGCVQLSHVRW